MELLIPLMPFLGALPIAVAAIVIARMWRGHRDRPSADLESQNEQLQAEMNTIREELREAQERLDFTDECSPSNVVSSPFHPGLSNARTRMGRPGGR
jgi:membrane protein implicated in regulation of membrane protease activity